MHNCLFYGHTELRSIVLSKYEKVNLRAEKLHFFLQKM